MTKTIAIQTMVRDEPEFLDLWLRYWRKFCPDADLYVIDDGPDETMRQMTGPANYVLAPDRPEGPDMDYGRWAYISDRCAALLDRYDVVVHTDVDELLIADPKTGLSVVELLKIVTAPVTHPLGLELVHRTDEAPEPLDFGSAVLRQRQIYRTSTNFSKAAVLTRPVRLSTGGHFSDQPTPAFLPGLMNVHLRFMDRDLFLGRAAKRRDHFAALFAVGNPPPFRRSAEGAEQTMDMLNARRILPFRSLITWPVRHRIQSTYPAQPDARGFYRFTFKHSRLFQRLPNRFLDLF